MKKTIGVIVSSFIVIFFLFNTVAFAQDPVKVCPTAFKERLNNSHTRVLEYSNKPGDKEAMHSHSPFVIYVVSGGKYRSTSADGKSTDIEVNSGDVVWRDAVTHSVENIGTTEIHAILVEIKGTPKKK